MTFLLAAVIVAITLGVTFWASRRNTSASDFYVAGGRISASNSTDATGK